MWELYHKEGWPLKNWCFWTVVLEKTLESSLACKEINSEYPFEGLMLKLQYFGHLIQRSDSLEKTLMLGNIDSRRKWGQQRMRWLDSITDSRDKSWANSEIVKDWCTAVDGIAVGHDLATEQQKNLTVNKKNTLWTGWVYPRNKRLTQHSKKSVEFSVSAYKRKTISKTAENHLLTIPTTTRLHALKGWILWYVN